jgi:hypothetical protein
MVALEACGQTAEKPAMRSGIRTVAGISAVAMMWAAGCAESVTSVNPQHVSATSNSLLGELTSTLTSALVSPVERRTPLPADVSWSFTAGPSGAFSMNSSVGLMIQIPPGALTSTQTITVTALAGSPVAYKFEPHGLQFEKKAYLTQDLRLTTSGILNLLLRGAYFSSDRLDVSSSGQAIVSELLAAVVSPLTRTVTFGIQHFSGYIVASGYSSGDVDAF